MNDHFNDNEICQCEHVHETVIEKVRAAMPDDDVLYDISELFKVFGDSTRTRILSALNQSEMCVCDLCELLNMTKSAVSHQLRTLRQSKLVKARRSGKEVFYSLADAHIQEIFVTAIQHVTE